MNTQNAGNRFAPGLMIRLATADLRHEWILNLCIVLALAAVIAPLLLIFGLKFGTIETLRLRLIEDPSKREVRLRTSLTHPPEWLRALARRPDVGFLVPMTRQIANDVPARLIGGANSVKLALLPTAPGDALLTEYKTPIPGLREAVLTGQAADALGVVVGNDLSLEVHASQGGEERLGTVKLRVVGVLDKRASGLNALFAPLPLLEAVEAFKDGLAVPEFGWQGTVPEAQPIFDGAVLLSQGPLTEEKQQQLLTNTGLGSIKKLDTPALQSIAGWTCAEDVSIYLLSNEQSPVGADTFQSLRDRLRGGNTEVFPWVRPLALAATADGRTHLKLRVTALSVTKEKAEVWKIQPLPEWVSDTPNTLRIMLPAEIPHVPSLRLSLGGADSSFELPVAVAPTRASKEGLALVPAQLAGVLRLAQTRPVRYDAKLQKVLLERRGYASFRLYARSIDDVESLGRYLESEGLSVFTETQRIHEVMELDRQLGRIFWLIAAVGVSGGLAALVASLYASIERKRRDLSILRLIGLSRWKLVRFPAYQSLLLVSGSFAVAMGLFGIIATTINTLFQSQLSDGESFCRIPIAHGVFAYSAALLFAAAATLAAAVQVSRAQPADALREE